MRILIVDDEPLVRAGMRSIIDWEKYSYEIVGEAVNGAQALGIIRQCRPHIILTDIMMPVMDGIELIKAVRAERLECKFIVLSCVTETQYLQQVINLGVSRYVLKSTTRPNEILDMVNEVAQEIRMQTFFDDEENSDATSQNLHFNEFVNMVFKNKLTNTGKIKQFLSNYLPASNCFLLVTRMENNGKLKTQQSLFSIASVVQNIICDMGGGYTFVNFDDYICTFFASCKKREIDEICVRIKSSISDCFDINLSFGLWDDEAINEFNLLLAYEKCCRQLDKEFHHINKDISQKNAAIDDLKTQKLTIIGLDATAPMEKFLDAIKTIQALLINTVTKESETKKLYLSIANYIILTFGRDEKDIMEALGIKMSVRNWVLSSNSFDEVHEKVVKIIHCVYNVVGCYILHTDENIDHVLAYVWGNCTQKITLNDLAEQLHLRPDYICKFFKKKTNTNLMDYIMQYKIIKSKQLLNDGASVSAVSEQLGFSSDSHFSKTFKKYMNISPGSFSTKLHKEKNQPAK